VQFRLKSIAILSVFVANFLLVGTRIAGAATATATSGRGCHRPPVLLWSSLAGARS